MAAYPPFGSQHQQSANSNTSPSSQPTRGRILFVSSPRQSRLSKKNLEDLLLPENNGEIGGDFPRQFHFKLTDKDGKTVAGQDIDHSVYAYPGNPRQALYNPNSANIDFSNRRKTNDKQEGAGLAEIAQKLIEQGKHALALPTTFTFRNSETREPLPEVRQGYRFYWNSHNPIHMFNREQLARLQLHYAEEILNQGRDVVIFVTPVNSAFQYAQSIVFIDGQEYYLAFWGGIEPGNEAGFLPTLYFQEIKKLASGEALSEPISNDVVPAFGSAGKEVNIGPLLDYARAREISGPGFTFFGGFSKEVKLFAATKMIFKLAELNGFVSAMENQLPIPILSAEEQKALNEENSDLHKAVETTLEGVSDKNIRGEILRWMGGASSHCFSL